MIKMKQEIIASLAIGVILGMFTMGLMVAQIGPNSSSKVADRKAACEINLPRNQVCVMQFVPESVDR